MGREPIAIIGMGCRLPGAASPSAFWDLLAEGGNAVKAVPSDRWDDPAVSADPESREELAAVGRAGLIDEVDGFDWRAFRIPPREAKYLDPQHRLLLEVSWEALEDAGLPFEEVAGTRTGVFVAIMWNDYLRLQSNNPGRLTGYSSTGNEFAFAPNRVSYTFDLRGPSLAIDAACAGSLASVHAACQSLWLRGERPGPRRRCQPHAGARCRHHARQSRGPLYGGEERASSLENSSPTRRWGGAS